MKSLPITVDQYQYILKSFTEWLGVTGYSEQIVYNAPNSVRELLHWSERQNIKNIINLTSEDVQEYYDYLKYRKRHKKYGALSYKSLNKHIQSLKLFSEYLKKSGRHKLAIPLKGEKLEQDYPEVLTREELEMLYKASYEYEIRKTHDEALGSRDRAMLAIFYGCGLRRREGVYVDLSDINFDTGLLKVRKGKNYKERYVPMSKQTQSTLKEYIYEERQKLLTKENQSSLFISQQGRRMQGQSLLRRLHILQYRVEELEEKNIGLHTLRHSIATHLLQRGMSLENISRFLGHDSLESTQLYTQLV